MLNSIAGIIFIIAAIWGVIYTLYNKKHMPFSVFGLQKEKYQVINKERFNNVMLTQSICLSMCFGLIGFLCMFINEIVIPTLACLNIFIQILFAIKAKKSIEIK